MLLNYLPPCLNPGQREVPWELAPFTNQEAADVQGCLRDIATKHGKDPTRTTERWWPVVREAADVCALNLGFDALRSGNPNHMRQMRRSLKRVQKTGNLPKNFKHLDALKYGARRAELKGDLSLLGPQELREAAKASLAHGPVNNQFPGNTKNIMFNTDLPPSPRFLLWCKRQTYPAVLAHIYRRITGKKPGYSTPTGGTVRGGPAVRFYMACLAPVHPNPTSDVVVHFIKKLPIIWLSVLPLL